MSHHHEYRAALRWEDDAKLGTVDYRTYSRRWRVGVDGKPALVGSADPTFRGDPTLPNPEDLLVASLASCHLLSYLAHCAWAGVKVVAYHDQAHGRMVTQGTGGHFEEVVLHPTVTITPESDLAKAVELHHRAHDDCFIASSVNFPVRCEPTVIHAPLRQDLAVRLPDRPGALAELGEVLGKAGISLEGGGGFAGVVHFLVAEAPRAALALRAAGFEVLAVRDVVVQRLDQERPGQLGLLARAMADAGVNIDCVYSDHDHQLVLCVDDLAAARTVSAAWSRRPGG